MRNLLGLLLIVTFLLVGCSSPGDEENSQDITPTTDSATPKPPPTPQVTLSVPEPRENGPIVLNIWLIEGVNPFADTPGATILAEQLATFETNRPGVDLNIEIKAATGPGSSLGYLRTGRTIAPSILPDLIVLPAEQLEEAISEQLIVPIDNLIVPTAVADLYPAADELARVDGKLVGFPFSVANLSHMAYQEGIFDDSVPTTWVQLVDDEEATFTFPGAGVKGAELALQMYRALGGNLRNESGQAVLELEPLAATLDLLRTARRQGLLPLLTVNMAVLDESWQAFDGGLVNSVMTTQKQFSGQRANNNDIEYSAIPGPDEPLAATITAQTWAISTLDPSRQTLVADLLNWLIAGPNMGDWTSAAGILPARRSAFQEWPTADTYIQFIHQELERANPYPYSASGPIMEAVSIAVHDVLSLQSTAQQAAQEAVDSLAQ